MNLLQWIKYQCLLVRCVRNYDFWLTICTLYQEKIVTKRVTELKLKYLVLIRTIWVCCASSDIWGVWCTLYFVLSCVLYAIQVKFVFLNTSLNTIHTRYPAEVPLKHFIRQINDTCFQLSWKLSWKILKLTILYLNVVIFSKCP